MHVLKIQHLQFFNRALNQVPMPEESQELEPDNYMPKEDKQEGKSFGDFDIYARQQDVGA